MRNYSIEEIKKTNLADTFFGTYFYRKLSTYVTFYLARTNLTPNQVSILSLLFGILGSVFFLLPSFQNYLLGNLFLQLGMILDYSDGQIARLKKLGTQRGAWLDVVLGMIQNNIFIFCITAGLYFKTHSLLSLALGFFVLFAWNMTCFVHLNAMIFFPKMELKSTNTASKVQKKFAIKPQYLSIGSDVYFIIIGVTALLGFLSYGLLFMLMLGNLYWISVGILMFKLAKNVK